MTCYQTDKSVFYVAWRITLGLIAAVAFSLWCGVANAAKPGSTTPAAYSYYSVGNPDFSPTVNQQTDPSYVLMGGGPDVDEAFRWMIQRAGITTAKGGRLVVIRATGDGAYNPYIVCGQLTAYLAPSARV